MRLAGFGPGATDADEAIGLVLFEQRFGGLGKGLFAPENFHHRLRRAPAAARVGVGVKVGFWIDEHGLHLRALSVRDNVTTSTLGKRFEWASGRQANRSSDAVRIC